MESLLSDIIWLSDKRKKILILLLEGPKSSDEIKKEFGCTWRPLISPIKKLKEEQLIIQDDNNYRLTYVGKILTENMYPLLNILDMFECDYQYWKSRDFDPIPGGLMDRMGEIGNCRLLEPPLDRIFELDESFIDKISECKYINALSPFFHPEYIDLYCKMVSKKTRICLIFKEPVFERLRQECEDKLNILLDSENADILINRNDLRVPGVVVSDNAFLLSLFEKNGNYDHRDVIGFDNSSIRWGNDLFSYYRDLSERVK